MRLAAYAGTSAALAVGCLIKAFGQRPNYYSAAVYLSQSNACILILTNLALVCTVSFIYGFQRLLYGPLRPIEIEQLSEKAWYAVLDTLLAMPSLRDDVGAWLLITFVLLLAGKIWGWIAEGRVDILEQQPPTNPRLFHARLSASLLVSVAFDIYMCRYCLKSVMDDPRPGMMVIFTFEYAILTIFSLFTGCRYLLALYEAHIVSLQTRQKVQERKIQIREERLRALRETQQDEATLIEPTDEDVDENEIDVPGWEEKRRWLFGLELATDFIKLVVYTVFFTISMTFIGLPMHVMRDVFMTVTAFTKRIQDYSNYRRATHDMNNKYPDATAEELNNENTCIVCREAMVPWETRGQNTGNDTPQASTINEGLRAKKLPCGHILHLRCLKAWLERQQTCPTCRRPVITQPGTQGGEAGNRPLLGGGIHGVEVNNAQPGQPNAANIQDQQARQNRRNRMRWLNMGPIRIGFYNGPAHQIQQALRAHAADEAGANTQGPVDSTSPSATRTLSVQEHLRSAELRLLQDAHNLEVDRAQLAHVRALGVELDRLRALRVSAGSGPSFTNTLDSASRQIPSGLPPLPGNGESRVGLAMQQYLQPGPSAALGSDAAVLPEGMTLPEGWSLVPLQRSGGIQSQPQFQPPHTVFLPIGQPGIPWPHSFTPNIAQRNSGQGLPNHEQTRGDVHDVPASTENVSAVTTGPPNVSRSNPDQPQPNDTISTQTNSQSRRLEPTWGFPTQPSLPATNSENRDSATSGIPATSEQIFDGAFNHASNAQDSNGQATGSSSKGKIRSVELEEVSDDGEM